MNTRNISFKLVGTGTHTTITLEIPNICPYCQEKMTPDIILNTDYDKRLEKNIATLYQCSNCYSYFSKEYEVGEFSNKTSSHISYPVNNKETVKIDYDLPDEIDSFSEDFRTIFTESLTSEAYGLTSISGVGFRKSIEFLVKDFLINFVEHPDSEKVKTMNLSHAIDKIDNREIIHLAKASAWLGNDETHYQRKFENRDVSDMKRFIKALTFYVSSAVVAAEAKEFIDS